MHSRSGGRQMPPSGSPSSQDTAKPARAGSCWLLFHDWEPWTVAYVSCVVQRLRNCRRCGKLQLQPDTFEHIWSPWELYEFSRPPRHEDEASPNGGEITVTHQRQRCLRCGFVVDRHLRNGSMGPPPPRLASPDELKQLLDAPVQPLLLHSKPNAESGDASNAT